MKILTTSNSDAEGPSQMPELLNKPQAGADNSGEFLARVSDLGAVRQRPVPLFGKCLVAVLDDKDYYLGKDY